MVDIEGIPGRILSRRRSRTPPAHLPTTGDGGPLPLAVNTRDLPAPLHLPHYLHVWGGHHLHLYTMVMISPTQNITPT